MTDYPFRIIMNLVCSEFVPAFLRTKFMRALGFPISREACIWASACFRSRRVQIGDGAFINVGFYHDGYEMLEIGRNVRIGPYVRILTASHPIGPVEQRCLMEVAGGPVRIEDGCWIGAGVTILPGVTIRKGCVIGANSLVVKSTDMNGLYRGVPAVRARELDA